MTPVFKNSNGQLYTKRLFYETSGGLNDKSTVIYTLKDSDYTVDGVTYLSLYQRYLDMEDLTEFDFASTFFDSYEHFRILCQAEWFFEHVTRWRNELKLKLKAKALHRLKAVSSDTQNKNYFEANKLILSHLSEGDKDKPKRGRPNKEELAKAVKEVAKEDATLADDHKRIFA